MALSFSDKVTEGIELINDGSVLGEMVGDIVAVVFISVDDIVGANVVPLVMGDPDSIIGMMGKVLNETGVDIGIVVVEYESSSQLLPGLFVLVVGAKSSSRSAVDKASSRLLALFEDEGEDGGEDEGEDEGEDDSVFKNGAMGVIIISEEVCKLLGILLGDVDGTKDEIGVCNKY
jgi:hypothetical protein